MKNQEFPKKLTNEAVNQRAKNLEQKDQRTEQAIEKNDSALSFDADEEIKNKAQIDEDTKNKIDEIRNSIGISPADEVPPSIKMEERATNKLNQEKENSEETKLFAKNLKDIIDNISRDSKLMLDAFMSGNN